MLFLLFRLGSDRYALDTGQIAEILPLVEIKRIPRAPPGIAGAFNYRGTPVPVIDLSELTLDRPAQKRLSTRIIVVHYPDGNGEPRLLGLIAEQATATLRCEPMDFTSTGVDNREAPYLGPVTSDERGLVQWIKLPGLLPASVRELLYQQVAEI